MDITTTSVGKLRMKDTVITGLSGAGGGSNVTVTPVAASGTKIATITVDKVSNEIFIDNYVHVSGDTMTGTLSTESLKADNIYMDSLSCKSIFMTNSENMMQNYCNEGGHIEANMGKYESFRDRGTEVSAKTPVGGCVGALGYCILSAYNNSTNKGVLKLSGDITPLKQATTLFGDKCKWSLTIGGACRCYAFTISATEDITADDGTISAGVVYLKQAIDSDNMSQVSDLKLSSEECYVALWNNQLSNEDDIAFYSPFAVWAGNQKIPVLYNAHIEGNACRAIQRATHAEGRMCLADARYSHAEGSYSYATGIAGHAEGYKTLAEGYYSHTEGHSTTASDSMAHAEGSDSKATGRASHAEGATCTASGKFSHAEGNLTYATGEAAHSGGASSTSSGSYSFAHGYKNTASGNSAMATGYNCTAKSDYSFAGGYKTTAGLGVVGFKITAIDNANKVVTLDSLSCMWNGSPYWMKSLVGQQMKIYAYDNDYSNVLVKSGMTFSKIVSDTDKTVALSWIPTDLSSSIYTNKVLAFSNDIFATIGNTYTVGQGQCAFGTSTKAQASNSFATGNSTTASGVGSCASGYKATAKGKYSVVWNGNSSESYGSSFSSDGLFCINPVGGTSGFYIGAESLSAIIAAEVKKQIAAMS